MKTKNDIIIIGAGLGGLSSGAYLGRKGYKVRIFERLSHPGGMVYTFKRKNYWFEASSHQFTGFKNSLLSKTTLKNLGLSRLPYYELDESFEAVLFGKNEIKKRFFIQSGYKNALQSFINYFPGQEKIIKDLFKTFKNVSRDSLRTIRLELENPFFHLFDALTALCLLKGKNDSLLQKIGIKSYPWLVKHMDHTFHDIIKDVKDPYLVYLLSQYSFFVGTPPKKISGIVMCLMIMSLMLDKPFFIKGGAIRLIHGLCEEINKHNGIIEYKQDVAEILIRDKKAVGIRLTNGEEHYADYVISNVNAYSTYHTLIKDKLILPEILKEKIENYVPGWSIFQTYLGLPFDLRDYGYKIASYLFSPGLDVDEVLSNPEQKSFILTNYTLMDPGYSPPGTSSIVLARFCDYKPWMCENKKTYMDKKQQTQKEFIKHVMDLTGIPLEKADVVFSASPGTFIHYSNNPFGSAIGAEHNLKQSGLERFHQKSPVPNLFLAGHDTKPGGGIGSSLGSGIIAARYLMKQG